MATLGNWNNVAVDGMISSPAGCLVVVKAKMILNVQIAASVP